MDADVWDPEQYHRFRAQRAKPFHDLLRLVEARPGGRLLDLGCGSGELAAAAMEAVDAAETVGVDTSPAMLAAAATVQRPGLRFVQGDLAEPPVSGPWDLVLANASLHWVPEHAEVLARWRGLLGPGGQLAVQVPANPDHPSHTTITEVLSSEPFVTALDGAPPPDPLLSVLPPQDYAELLWELGASEQVVRLEVYGMEMPSVDAVADWTAGTAMVRARNVLDAGLYERFEAEYRRRLAERLAHAAPYFYAFERILMWARFD